jgi:HEAT repeat protein
MFRLRICLFALFYAGIRAGADVRSDTAWTLIRSGLGDQDSDRRAKAVQVLGLLPNEDYAEKLALNSLRDPEPRVRALAAAALGQMKAASAIPDLKTKLNDPDSLVVLAAADSLIELNESSGYGIDYEILTGERKGGRGLQDQGRDLLAHPKELEKLGIQQGIGFIPYGGISYTAFKLITKDSVTPARAKAARALAKDPDPRSRLALVKALGDSKWLVRAACATAIAERDDSTLLPSIEVMMQDPNDVVKYTAAAAVIRLSDDASRK